MRINKATIATHNDAHLTEHHRKFNFIKSEVNNSNVCQQSEIDRLSELISRSFQRKKNQAKKPSTPTAARPCCAAM